MAFIVIYHTDLWCVEWTEVNFICPSILNHINSGQCQRSTLTRLLELARIRWVFHALKIHAIDSPGWVSENNVAGGFGTLNLVDFIDWAKSKMQSNQFTHADDVCVRCPAVVPINIFNPLLVMEIFHSRSAQNLCPFLGMHFFFDSQKQRSPTQVAYSYIYIYILNVP